jgi:DNA end-binding protein Ku
VKAYTAVREHRVRFHELDAKGSRVRHEKVSASSGKEVQTDEVQLGFETTKGHYVRFTKSELEELRPASTQSIDIEDFVDLADIDPIFYDHTYWLAPDGKTATHAYALLRDSMEDEQKVGIGAVVMRRKQYLAAIRPVGGALAMSTMRFADEVVPSSDIESIPKRAGTAKSDKEMKLARQIIESLSTQWKPEKYHDTYTEELRSIIDKKRKGKEIKVAEDTEEKKADVVDLMAALEESVKKARARKSSSTTRRKKSA